MSRIFQLLQRHLQHVIGRNDDNAGEKLYVFSWEANFAEVVCTLSPKSHESKLEKKQCLLSTQHFFLSCSPSAVFFYADNFLLPEMRDKEKEE